MSGSPDGQTDALTAVADAMADADTEYDHWTPGVGPFEEPRQLAALVDALPAEERPRRARGTLPRLRRAL